MSLTCAILDAHGAAEPGDGPDAVRRVRPDLLLGDRRSARFVLGRFAASGSARAALDCVLARDRGGAAAWSAADPEMAEFDERARSAGVELAPAGAGDRATLALELLAAPGRLIATLGPVPEAGALGTLAVEVGDLEALDLLAGRPLELEAGPMVRLELEGGLPARCDGLDVAAALIAGRPRRLAGVWIEVGGPGVATLSISDRIAMCRALSDAGVRVVLFPCDEVTREELMRRGREADWRATQAGAPAEDVLSFDLGWTVPHAISRQRPARAVPLAWWAGVGVASVDLGPGLSPETLAWCAGLLRGRAVPDGTLVRARAWSARLSTSAAASETAEVFAASGVRWVREGELPPWKRRPGRLRLFAGRVPPEDGADPDDWMVGIPAAIESACRGRIEAPETWPDPGDVPKPAVPVAGATVLASLRASGSGGARSQASPAVDPARAGPGGRGSRGRSRHELRGAVLGVLEGTFDGDALLPTGPRLESVLADPMALAEHLMPAMPRAVQPAAARRWLIVLGEVKDLAHREAGLVALRALGVRGLMASAVEPEARGLLARAGILALRALNPEELEDVRAGDELELVGGVEGHEPDRARVVRNLTRGFALVALPEQGRLEWTRLTGVGA